jgi:hypothetical protein
VSRDRDRIVEQALKHELRAAGTPPAGPARRSFSEGGCLDAETLGAWTDGGLDPAAMAAAETHVSNCARCQALVGTVARGAPITQGTQGTLGTQGLSLWRWWLAPIAAGVTAVTLWMVVPEEQQHIATAPPQAKASAEVQPSAPVEGPPPARIEVGPSAPGAAIGAAQPPLARDNLSAAARDDRARNAVTEERKEEAAQRQQERFADAAAAPAPAAPPPPAAVALEAPAIGGLQKSARASAAVAEIATFDANRRWRVAGDRIERTVDRGKSWTLVHQEPGAGLTAGSAPSLVVCWFVGRAGTVIVTTDAGETFRRADLAEPLDLVSVSAVDARNAAIYSVNGRRFRTADGGISWTPF